MPEPSLFRPSALEQLSSPERLDTLMAVAQPRHWLALGACAAALGGALVWGTLGRTRDRVEGPGVLAQEGGPLTLFAPGTGTLMELRGEPGGKVAAGARLARFARPELQEQLDAVVALLRALQREEEQTRRLARRDTPAALAALALEREREVLLARRRALAQRLERETWLLSPCPGELQERLRQPGEAVQAGTPVLRLGAAARPLVCYLFVARHSRRIRPGMKVTLQPAGVNAGEFGSMVGRVLSVTPQPLDPEALTALVGSPALATRLSAGGPVYGVAIAPERDPATPSGFRWTRGEGPPFRIQAGTGVEAQVVVKEEAPILRLLPSLAAWFRG